MRLTAPRPNLACFQFRKNKTDPGTTQRTCSSLKAPRVDSFTIAFRDVKELRSMNEVPAVPPIFGNLN